MILLVNDENVIINIAENAYYAKVVGEGDAAHLGECTQQEATHIFVPDQNLAYMANAGTLVEVQNIPENVTAYNYKYVNNEFVINAEFRAEEILKELAELDKTINRATEDLYIATNTTPYEAVATVIARKNELRQELAEYQPLAMVM